MKPDAKQITRTEATDAGGSALPVVRKEGRRPYERRKEIRAGGQGEGSQAPRPVGETPRKRGGQTVYTQELADEICLRLSNGESLNAICKTTGMPGEATVRDWQLNDLNGFAAKYAHARIAQAHRWAEEIVTLSDMTPPLTPDGRYDSGAVAHQRLMVDTRKWLLSKVLPKVYGDRVNLDHAGEITLTVITGVPSADET